MIMYRKALPRVWSSFVNSNEAAVSVDPGSCLSSEMLLPRSWCYRSPFPEKNKAKKRLLRRESMKNTYDSDTLWLNDLNFSTSNISAGNSISHLMVCVGRHVCFDSGFAQK